MKTIMQTWASPENDLTLIDLTLVNGKNIDFGFGDTESLWHIQKTILMGH